MKPQKTLVVYYTSTGNTRRVAEVVAERLTADLEEIRPKDKVEVDIKGKGLRNFLNMGRVVFGGKAKRAVDLESPIHDPADYDLVVVGTPVYANTLPAEPRMYLVEQRDRFKSVAFFCTGEAPDNSHVFDLMREACGLSPKAIQPFHAPEIRAQAFLPDVDNLVDNLNAGWRAP